MDAAMVVCVCDYVSSVVMPWHNPKTNETKENPTVEVNLRYAGDRYTPTQTQA